jgi:hypothetical protein
MPDLSQTAVPKKRVRISESRLGEILHEQLLDSELMSAESTVEDNL